MLRCPLRYDAGFTNEFELGIKDYDQVKGGS